MIQNKDLKFVARLNLWFKGSGNPTDEHKILGLSIGDTTFGKTNYQDKVDGIPMTLNVGGD